MQHDCPTKGFSQGNQDCILDRIFEVIGTTNKYYVEYGFNANNQCTGTGPNTCKLWKDGWNGLLLTAEFENISINLRKHFIFSTTIHEIFEGYNVPISPDFISSDMDSYDLFVLQKILQKYTPRVVTTEYNSNWPIGWHMSQVDPSLASSIPKDENFVFRQCVWGCSASAIRLVLENAGYSLVGVSTRRLDLVWVKTEILAEYDVPPFSWFVPFMQLGSLHHEPQEDWSFLHHMANINTWLDQNENMKTAQDAAANLIRENVLSSHKLPCFHKLLVT